MIRHTVLFTKWLLIVLSLVGVSHNLWAATSQSTRGDHIEVTGLIEDSNWQPGQTHWVGVLFEPDEKWHTYWLNPGDSGEAPRIALNLPTGFSVGDIVWPVPTAIPVAHLINYGYDKNLLMLPVTVPVAWKSSPINIDIGVSWLVCKEDCVPGKAKFNLSVAVQDEIAEPAVPHPAFERARQQHYQDRQMEAQFELTEEHLVVFVPQLKASDQAQLLPFSDSLVVHSGDVAVQQSEQGTSFILPRSELLLNMPDKSQWLLIDPATSQTFSFVAMPSGETAFDLTSTDGTALITADSSLLMIVFYALLGGMLLNLMPCVLPVLALKAMSLSSGSEHVRRDGLLYLLGVLVSFVVFWGVIQSLKQGGDLVGWGFQMQSPWVVAGLTLLFLVIALNLLDVLTVRFSFSGVGQSLTESGAGSASFFTGVLAVVVASPCTAPGMAAALGFAMVASTWHSLAVFIGLAFGFAIPMVALQLLPGTRRWLPKPGIWMERFKQGMAFPMLATCLWLVFVYQGLVGAGGAFILLALLLLFSFLVWLTHSNWRPVKWLAGAAAVCLPVLALSWLPHDSNVPVPSQQQAGLEQLPKLRQQHNKVLVNVTADWCISCKVNEQVAFSDNDVKAMLNSDQVYYLTLDWTAKDEEILQYLKGFQRSGVPLYVLYRQGQPPQVLPQLFTANQLLSYLKN